MGIKRREEDKKIDKNKSQDKRLGFTLPITMKLETAWLSLIPRSHA